jgi:hypothetical protein
MTAVPNGRARKEPLNRNGRFLYDEGDLLITFATAVRSTIYSSLSCSPAASPSDAEEDTK